MQIAAASGRRVITDMFGHMLADIGLMQTAAASGRRVITDMFGHMLADIGEAIAKLPKMEDLGKSIRSAGSRVLIDGAKAEQAAIDGLVDTAKKYESQLKANSTAILEHEQALTMSAVARDKAIASAAQSVHTAKEERETQRLLNREMREAENQFNALDAAHSKLIKSATEQAKATTKSKDATKKKTKAEKEAEKAAKALAKEQERIAKTRAEGLKVLNLSRKKLDVYAKTGKEATKIIDGLTLAESREVAENKKRLDIMKLVNTAKEKAKAAIAALTIGLTLGTEAMAAHNYELQGYTANQALAQVADDKKIKSMQQLLDAQNRGKERLKELKDATVIHTIAIEKGSDAADLYAKTIEYGSAELAKMVIEQEKLAGSTGEMASFWVDAKDAVADFVTGAIDSWDDLRKVVTQPIKAQLQVGVQQLFQGNGSGKLLDTFKGIGSILNPSSILGGIGKIGTSIGGIFNGSSGLFSGISGIASGLGSVVPAIGLAVSAFDAVKDLFSSKKTVTADFQSNTDRYNAYGGSDGSGIGRNTTGQAFYRDSLFGSFGLRARGKGGDTVALNRDQQGQIEAVMQVLDSMQAVDELIGTFVSDSSVANVKTALDGFRGNALKPEQLFEERLSVIFSALPEVTQSLVDFSQPAENVIARITQISESATTTVPALESLGFNLGDVKEKSVASALGLTDLSGGLQGFMGQFENYISTIYTEEEQLQVKQATAANALVELNNSLGLTGDAVIDTKDELKAYVNELNSSGALQTEAGQEAFTAAISSANAVATIAESGMTLSEVIAGLDQNLLGVAVAVTPLESATSILTETGKMAADVIHNIADSLGEVAGIKSVTEDVSEEYNDVSIGVGELNDATDQTNERLTNLEEIVSKLVGVTEDGISKQIAALSSIASTNATIASNSDREAYQ